MSIEHIDDEDLEKINKVNKTIENAKKKRAKLLKLSQDRYKKNILFNLKEFGLYDIFHFSKEKRDILIKSGATDKLLAFLKENDDFSILFDNKIIKENEGGSE